MAHQSNRAKFIDAIIDLNRVPEHLLKKWWRENCVLRNENGAYCWPAGLPRSMPIDTLHRLYKEFTFWTTEPVGLYNPENLGRVDPNEQSRDH